MLDSFLMMLVKLAGALMVIALSIVITRTGGKSAFGIISLSNQILNIALLVVIHGYSQITTREVSRNREDLGYLSLIYTALRTTIRKRSVFAWVAMLVITYPLFRYVFDMGDSYAVFVILSVGFVAQTVSRAYSSFLLGLKKVWQSNLTEQTLTSALTLVFMLIYQAFGQPFSLYYLALSYMLSRFLLSVLLGSFLRGLLVYSKHSDSSEKKHISEFEGYNSKASKLSFLLIAIASYGQGVLNSLILGYTGTASDVGVFNIIMKIATPIAFILLSLQRSSMPRIAKFYSDGDVTSIRRLFVRVGFISALGGVLFFLVVFIWGRQILTIWNIDDTESYQVLLIISLAFLVNAATSVAGPVLAMTGEEKIHSRISIFTLIVQLVSGLYLSIHYGLIGAAVAYLIVMLTVNLSKVFFVYRKVFSQQSVAS